MALRNMGGQSTSATMSACAMAAEDAGLESVWVVDHIDVPPDDAQGSNGRYVDPLVSLAFVLGGRYVDSDEYRQRVDALTAAVSLM